jgi:hypothetical protein
MARGIRVYVYPLKYSLPDLQRCHGERAVAKPSYMEWCSCASRGANGSNYADPLSHDMRGAVGAEIYMYAGLTQQRLGSWGVTRTLEPADADLFFVPLFAALSFMLGASSSGTCAGLTHAERLLSALDQVHAAPAFAAWPSRHFVFGAAELVKCIFLSAKRTSLRLDPYDPFATRVANMTRTIALINMENRHTPTLPPVIEPSARRESSSL